MSFSLCGQRFLDEAIDGFADEVNFLDGFGVISLSGFATFFAKGFEKRADFGIGIHDWNLHDFGFRKKKPLIERFR